MASGSVKDISHAVLIFPAEHEPAWLVLYIYGKAHWKVMMQKD